METVQNFVARQMANYDRNHNNLIELTTVNLPFVGTVTQNEAPGRAHDFFQRSAALGVVCDAWSLDRGVRNEIDGNRDGYVSIPERIIGWFKTGLW